MYFTIEAIFLCPSTEDWTMVEVMQRIVFATNKPKQAELIAREIIQTRWTDFGLPIEPIECNIRLLPYVASKVDGCIIRPINL